MNRFIERAAFYRNTRRGALNAGINSRPNPAALITFIDITRMGKNKTTCRENRGGFFIFQWKPSAGKRLSLCTNRKL
jgi:hypothetical protein